MTHPIDSNNLIIVLISFTFGRLFKTIFFFDKIVAAKIGSAAFFEPEIFTLPLSLLPPKTSNLSIIKL